MLIENDFKTKEFEDGLMMVRDYKEYFKSCRKNIFLTGGAGFIGSNILEQIINETEHSITIFDNLATVNCGLENINY